MKIFFKLNYSTIQIGIRLELDRFFGFLKSQMCSFMKVQRKTQIGLCFAAGGGFSCGGQNCGGQQNLWETMSFRYSIEIWSWILKWLIGIFSSEFLVTYFFLCWNVNCYCVSTCMFTIVLFLTCFFISCLPKTRIKIISLFWVLCVKSR